MNKRTIATCFAALAMLAPQLLARIHETEAEIETRYGKPVSKSSYEEVDPTYDAKAARRERERSAWERDTSLKDFRDAFPDRFNKDGTRIDFAGEDALIYADKRIMFFNRWTSQWERFDSHVIGEYPTAKDSDTLKELMASTRKSIRQRFYVHNGIGISVVYANGHSISESYRQKTSRFDNDSVNELIIKSFPDSVLDDDDSNGYPRFIRILSNDSKELRGSATHLDGILTISATLYVEFLKSMETRLEKDADIKQKSKLNGF